ncbi:hypothetical protein [Arcobacter sp. F2176]|uniref:hypothetical protein n=1 Tax=Arcobacter sp. F2176 TaxID=2044511 RepID=UPI00100B9473|nr:hypothetical protein [Arcobacter sp. F2176]RXJ81865.1 hypothetical protein CRU95_05860 [Arcobacter sp. F2176]
MQIFLGIILVIILIGIIIYKLNNKFEKKEIILLSSIVIVVILVFTMYQKNQENFFPNTFKEKYKQENNIEILKLSSELLNNKVVSSKDHYIYKFTYIIKKNGKEYLCVANNVNINKIQDEYIFDKWTEECKEQ